MPEKELQDREEQLQRVYTDKDRERLIKQIAANYKLTCVYSPSPSLS
jgi:hypothetical protein